MLEKVYVLGVSQLNESNNAPNTWVIGVFHDAETAAMTSCAFLEKLAENMEDDCYMTNRFHLYKRNENDQDVLYAWCGYEEFEVDKRYF